MRYPSVKTLLVMTRNRPTALAVRKVLDERTPMKDQWGGSILRHCSFNDDAKLAAADRLLDNHGVEWLMFNSGTGCPSFGAYAKVVLAPGRPQEKRVG